MARLSNSERRPFPLPTGHVVPANGVLETTNAVLTCADNAAVLSGPILSGQLLVEYDPAPVFAPPPEAAENPTSEPPSPLSDTPVKGKAKGA